MSKKNETFFLSWYDYKKSNYGVSGVSQVRVAEWWAYELANEAAERDYDKTWTGRHYGISLTRSGKVARP